MDYSTSYFPIHHQSLELAQTHVYQVSNAIQSSHPILLISSISSSFCCPLLLLFSIFPGIRVFFKESTLDIRQPKYGSFSFSTSPSNEYSGLISFRIDWFNLFAVQGPQFKSINPLALSLPYGPSLISVHDYWKNRRFDYTDLCQQSDVSAF